METESAKLFATAIAIAIGAMGPGVAIGLIGSKAVEAIGRNPDIEGSLFSKMIIGVAMTETTAIFALVAFFLLG